MIIGIALLVAGTLLTTLMPILFFIGIPMALLGLAMMFLYFTKNSASLVTAVSRGAYRAATTKNCDDCKSRIAADAIACAQCGFRYDSEERLASSASGTGAPEVVMPDREVRESH